MAMGPKVLGTRRSGAIDCEEKVLGIRVTRHTFLKALLFIVLQDDPKQIPNIIDKVGFTSLSDALIIKGKVVYQIGSTTASVNGTRDKRKQGDEKRARNRSHHVLAFRKSRVKNPVRKSFRALATATLQRSCPAGLACFVPLKVGFSFEDLHTDPITAFYFAISSAYGKEQNPYATGATFYPKGIRHPGNMPYFFADGTFSITLCTRYNKHWRTIDHEAERVIHLLESLNRKIFSHPQERQDIAIAKRLDRASAPRYIDCYAAWQNQCLAPTVDAAAADASNAT
ncbi:hypothetical protein BDP27DRAFT_1372455 [Rhodocollybia butyracea]|uniref:Uncharacterized protein n=1 Tax=Rhodocollybia butyracea TaxID=206335 RepID=A0A9P5PA48_9AGAR|nr:hypothetical protein BDP27DRAFT_1372455 [Rhodocollybia butyracea]